MGVHEVSAARDEQELAEFTRAALRDLAALEQMLDADALESGVRRIGAEQEMFLIDTAMAPAPLAIEVLKAADDDRFTTEIGRFNLEANLPPHLLAAGCLHQLEADLVDAVTTADRAAQQCGARVLLAGILPTLRQSDLGLHNLTPLPRYEELDRQLRAMRGSEFVVHIKGVDELHVTHDNVMFEACNASYQVHYQVPAKHFAREYNIAQAVTAPLLAAAVNSPLLLGHRLWQETRLALFQHAVDERSTPRQARSSPTRVGFGDGWLTNSVLELYRDNLTRFRSILVGPLAEDPLALLARGGIPKLTALSLHNGTVWRWNRACYGVLDGKASLRLENRVLPSGPTIRDEVANTAFLIGLLVALPEEYGDIRHMLDFDDAKANLFAAARHGLDAQLVWANDRRWTAQSLIGDHLLPLARAGLASVGLPASEVDRFLGVIADRVASGRTAARWALQSVAGHAGGTTAQRDKALVAAMLAHQHTGEPVHTWASAPAESASDWLEDYRAVQQVMSTDLFTVAPDEPIDLVASVMDWRHIRHVPVEDGGKLIGLISHRDLLRTLATPTVEHPELALTARSLMTADPLTVTPATPTLTAMEMMREFGVGCLPVVEADRLVGIVTASDFLAISYRCLRQAMAD
jgi:CBS domain-containing protein